ncbi:MAG: ATP-dependent DNA helicase RecG [Verrucomicrobiales bacterium]|nr:ATP-dependent DNA helicase RecG [Verrucomicrobiales bacterium]
MLTLDTPLNEVGSVRIDKKMRDGMGKMGLHSVGDLLQHYPRRYEDRRHFDTFPEGPTEHPVCLHIEVVDCSSRFGKGRGRRWFEAIVEPKGGANVLGNRIVLRWFNLAYIQKIITVGHEMVLFGQPKWSGRRLVIDHPDFEIVDGDTSASEAHMGRIVPIYPLVSGVSQKPLRTLAYRVLSDLPDDLPPEWLPPGACPGGLSKARAIRGIHYPDSMEDLEPARRYLALEEFARLQLVLQKRRSQHRESGGAVHAGHGNLWQELQDQLPFEPTGAQCRTIEEIRTDLSAREPMVRLLQGDVGAGKTLVAAAAVSLVVEAGFDAALMAPTQILAEQHFQTFQSWFEPLGIEVKLKTGNRAAGGDLPLFSGNAGKMAKGSLTIGTHALIHDKEGFANGLGLAVIDEQHKFGVAQRQSLIERGDTPDVLVMTATPIPRTLALAFYGDLDVSILDELPPGRGRIITGIRLTSQTEQATGFLRDQLREGRQAYVVYPLIEESEKLKANAATVEFEAWKKRLPEAKLVLLHGKMTPEEKESVMGEFRSGQAQVLVSTTVIEVGVDVPNANVMLIYNAERFGLAQIHQLRGRIGRGRHKSFCVLMIDPDAAEARERLRVLEETRDGFRIADEDLRQRGPGEVLGTQQSGLPDLKFGDFLGDTKLVEQAKEIAERILESDREGEETHRGSPA